MSFIDQKIRIATEEDCSTQWGSGGKRFGCYFCGNKFKVGDQWRFVLATQLNYINFLVCKYCDGDDVLERWVRLNKQLEKYFWLNYE
jgi:hypothetical protein